MSDLSHDQEKAIFEAARHIRDRAERTAFVEQACGQDRSLVDRILGLLSIFDANSPFLETPVVMPDASAQRQAAAIAGSVLGRYRLVELINEGGMGEVWVAEQLEPVRRQVALKLIAPGRDSSQVLARFEAERQVLAVMDHPNIAKVLDGGATEPESTGGRSRPYFVMELVQGPTITTFCDSQRLSLRQRLELFVPVCRAIQHAHQKGIIHRDIKPNNVLVATYDGRPVPKVIDFGVAKAVGSELTHNSLETQLGLVVGTPQYMSPEQAQANSVDIDTRSDIYSLGVLLYELLTGSPPVNKEQLAEAGILEILRVVREVDPPTPSTRLQNTAELTSLAAQRGIEPKKLATQVHGELDWIVMKSLEKDRNRRYATANGLANDIERYLHDEPVEAHPPSAAYRVQKFVRRHRGPVAAGTLLLLSLVGGIVGTAIGLYRADQQRQLAEGSAQAERMAHEAARKRLTQIEKGNEILGSIFRDLDPHSETNEGKNLRSVLAERLDEAVRQLEKESVGDELAVARLQKILGTSLLSLGYGDKAIVLLSKAHAHLAQHFGKDYGETLAVAHKIGMCHQAAGQIGRALQAFEEVREMSAARYGPTNGDMVYYSNSLASIYLNRDQPEKAVPLLQNALDLRRQSHGANDYMTMSLMTNLSLAYSKLRQPELALPLLEESYQLRKAKNGPNHVSTLATMNNLATAYRDAGKTDQSLELQEETLRLATQQLGPDHPNTIIALNNVAWQFMLANRLARALELYQRAAALLEKRRYSHEHAGRIMGNLASCHFRLQQFEQAESVRRKWLAVLKERGLGNSLDYAGELEWLALYLESQQKLSDAETSAREALTIRRNKEPDDWKTFNVAVTVGDLLLKQSMFSDAEPFLIDGFEGLHRRAASISPPSAKRPHYAATRLVQLYELMDKPVEVALWRQKLAKLEP